MGYEVSISLQKDYVDRGVQTGHLKGFDGSLSTPISSITDKHFPSDFHALGEPTILQPSNHSRSAVLTSSSNGLAQDRVPSPSPKSQSHIYKYSGLIHKGHTQSIDAINRVVSLPETRPAVNVKAAIESGLRIVSMPECRRPSSSSLDHSDSLERSGFLNEISGSTDTSASTSSQTRQRLRQTGGRYSPSEIPQTPSQPSSPESIMIIGNDSPQVPRSFLCPKPNSTPAYTDDDGWITWASSPPRPIPALHGPLSLPYARCPSGAEGTLIEGKDQIPHMIWGLDSNTTRPSQAQHQDNIISRRTATQHRSASTTQQARSYSSRNRNGSTSQQQSSLYTSHLEVPCQEVIPILPSYIGFNKHNDTPLKTTDNQRLSGRTIRIQQPSVVEMPESLWHANVGLGLGLDWNDAFAALSLEHTSTHGLDVQHLSSPIDSFAQSLEDARSNGPRIFVEPRKCSGAIQIPHRMSALDIAQRYHAEKLRQNGLPTPPNVSSPLWTPAPSSHLGLSDVNISLLHPRTQKHFQDLSQLQSMYALDDRPQDFHFSVAEQTGGEEIHLRSHLEARSPPTSFHSVYKTPHHPEAPQNSNHSADAKDSKPSLPPAISLGNNHSSRKLTPASSAPRRSLLGHQPSSIPLASLIQRRLSVVPEETNGRESYSTHVPGPLAYSQSYLPRSDNGRAPPSNLAHSPPPQASTPTNVAGQSYPSPLMSPMQVMTKQSNVSTNPSVTDQPAVRLQAATREKENLSVNGNKSRNARRRQGKNKNKNNALLSQLPLTNIHDEDESLW